MTETGPHPPHFPHDAAEAMQAIIDQSNYEELHIRPMRAAAHILGLGHLAHAVEALADMRAAVREGDEGRDSLEYYETAAFRQVDAAAAAYLDAAAKEDAR